MKAILRILDWDSRKVLAEKARNPINSSFPLESDWRTLFDTIPPRKGYTYHLLTDSCDTPEDTPFKELDRYVYTGYAKAVNNGEYWTEHDDSSFHKDGIRDIDGKWKIYDNSNDQKRDRVEEYAIALSESPFFYFIKDTGSCQIPNQERVYRIFFDPAKKTKLSLEYWGNLGSTAYPIYTHFILVDSTDYEHLSKISVQNGHLVAELYDEPVEEKSDEPPIDPDIPDGDCHASIVPALGKFSTLF